MNTNIFQLLIYFIIIYIVYYSFVTFRKYISTLAWELLSAFKPSPQVILTQSDNFIFFWSAWLFNEFKSNCALLSVATRAILENQFLFMLREKGKRKAKKTQQKNRHSNKAGRMGIHRRLLFLFEIRLNFTAQIRIGISSKFKVTPMAHCRYSEECWRLALC